MEHNGQKPHVAPVQRIHEKSEKLLKVGIAVLHCRIHFVIALGPLAIVLLRELKCLRLVLAFVEGLLVFLMIVFMIAKIPIYYIKLIIS